MDYVSVRVSTLRGDQKIKFNVFVQINGKMILYIRDGDSFEGSRLKRLKEKKLKKLFIVNDDESKYRDYLLLNIEKAYDNKSATDVQTRAEIIQGSQQSNVEEVFENPENAEAYNLAKESASKYVQFLLGHSEAIQSVLTIDNNDQNVAHHGVNVSTYAVSLAHKLGIVDDKQTQMLALGALLHDYGHNITQFLPSKTMAEMTTDEITVYKSHPEIGTKQVQDKKHFDQQVLNIIMKHEECIDGSGYPQQLRENNIDQLTQIVASANALDRMIIFEGVPRSEVSKKLMMTRVGKHPLAHLQHLAELSKTF
jgi:putative nucleotidyltransferase with HDIG domain